MKRNYTVAGIKALYELPRMDCCQITLNGRQFPSSRKTVAALQSLREAGIYVPIIVHYDFIYIVSRYLMFKKAVQEAIMEELTGLDAYASKDNNILGIVMHTDWPVKKEFRTSLNKPQFITDNYSGSLWDTILIKDHLSLIDNGAIVEASICKFYSDFKEHIGSNHVKVYLENTTKVGPDKQGTLQWLTNVIHSHDMESVFGIVYDTEHHYAVTGEWLEEPDIKTLQSNYDLIVHLNTVPKNVKPFSNKDSHSFTTISECSLHDKLYYNQYSNMLDTLGIPWVREVKEETMLREWNQ